jgi:DNA-binding transcriptional LysR family regulator
VPELAAAHSVRRGELARVLPAWSVVGDVCWAVFPGSKLMPAKMRVFIDMLRVAMET